MGDRCCRLELRQIQNHILSKPFLASILLLGIMAIFGSSLTDREEVIPQRMGFTDFPVPLTGWLAGATQAPGCDLS